MVPKSGVSPADATFPLGMRGSLAEVKHEHGGRGKKASAGLKSLLQAISLDHQTAFEAERIGAMPDEELEPKRMGAADGEAPDRHRQAALRGAGGFPRTPSISCPNCQ
jgi:hypothetical protein